MAEFGGEVLPGLWGGDEPVKLGPIGDEQRSVTCAAARYDASVWAMQSPEFEPRQPFDRALRDRGELWDGIQAFFLERDDEVALWLPEQAALLFADAMIRRGDGQLRVCPDSWTQPPGGADRLRTLLGALTELSAEHVLVSHGPLVTALVRSRYKLPCRRPLRPDPRPLDAMCYE